MHMGLKFIQHCGIVCVKIAQFASDSISTCGYNIEQHLNTIHCHLLREMVI